MRNGRAMRERYAGRGQKARPDPFSLDLIEEDGGPLIWPRITESAQNAFDATCRKLYRFLNQRRMRK